MVLYLDRAAPFFRLSNGFLPECRASRTQGAASFPWGGLYHHTRIRASPLHCGGWQRAVRKRNIKNEEEHTAQPVCPADRLVMAVCLLTGCGAADTEQVEAQEDAETIQVYLWTAALYDTYAPYIQAQLPDVNIEFIVGNNDLDFYKFLQQNGGLPDIITCCRFSLHDAAPLKDSLMDLSTTNEAGAVYNTYLNSFKNEDGSVNWLRCAPTPRLRGQSQPVCAVRHPAADRLRELRFGLSGI